MAAGNGDTQALQAVAVPEGQDRIFQTMTGKKKVLAELGLVQVTVVYYDQDRQHTTIRLVPHSTLDKVINTLDDEAVG